MPIVRIEFDDRAVTKEQVSLLSQAVQKITAAETGIEDVAVYANTALVKIKVAPIEIFIEISASKVLDLDDLFARIENGLSRWKTANKFAVPVNLTIIPMNWKFATYI